MSRNTYIRLFMISVFIVIIIAGLNSGREKEQDNSVQDNNTALLKEMENLNHNYVEYGGSVYYRKYHAGCFELGGVSQSFRAVDGINKEMMCISPDGERKELFTDRGSGAFYIVNDRFYMAINDSIPSTIYSVDMGGNDYEEYGTGYLMAADEDKNLVILELEKADSSDTESQIYIIDTISDERTLLKSTCIYDSFLAYTDGRIYFQEAEPVSLASGSLETEIRMYSILPDGTDEKILAQVSDTGNYDVRIRNIQLVDGVIYFSYGGYAGSAGAYQGGAIACVKEDGTGFRIIDQGNTEGNCISDRFFVQKTEDKIYIHYNTQFEMTGIHMVVKELTSGLTQNSNMPFLSGQGPGVLFFYRKAI